MRRSLSGWGRTAPTAAETVAPLGVADVRRLIGDGGGGSVLARGLGRSYGDAAQNAGGEVLDATSLSGIRAFDDETGRIDLDAGVSLDALMRWAVPRGWFPDVIPGTRFVTIGGAIAADIHGKNHHVDGSFSAAVEEMTLEAPVGTRELRPGDDGFRATVGGMGLTGVITAATLRLRPVTTSRMVVDTERARDLDHVMALMDEGDHRYRYSVAWIDCVASGSQLGRSVLTRGDHADVEDLPVAARRDPLAYGPAQLLQAPPWMPNGLLNPATVRAFNELWFRKAPRHRTGEVQSIPTFFHPLDAVAGWNRIYGSRGFVQYQFVVPFGAEETLRAVVERLVAARVASFLAVLKRFGPGADAPLSFPTPGWTLALDIPVGDPRLRRLLNMFDDWVASAGGRVYLAKDARLRPETLPRMYPQLDEWRTLRRALDPDGRMQSDLGRRLRLLD